MDEFVLIPLSFYKHLTSQNQESVNKDIDTASGTTVNDVQPSNAILIPSHVAESNKTVPTVPSDEIVKTEEKRWLQNVVSPEKNINTTESSSSAIVQKSEVSKLTNRKRRIRGVLDLLINCKEITFNTSTDSFNISSNSRSAPDLPETPYMETSLHILTFLRDLQFYQKKIPESYFPVLNLLFPPTNKNSVTRARELIINRNCLSYILNRNVHEQRGSDQL